MEDGFRIELPARAESIPRARSEVADHAGKLGLSAPCVASLKTVVSEACTNAVKHAYEEDVDGRLGIEVGREGDEMRVVVRDWGTGIRPQPHSDLPGICMGLPVIGALSSRFIVFSERGKGTEVEMRLPVSG